MTWHKLRETRSRKHASAAKKELPRNVPTLSNPLLMMMLRNKLLFYCNIHRVIKARDHERKTCVLFWFTGFSCWNIQLFLAHAQGELLWSLSVWCLSVNPHFFKQHLLHHMANCRQTLEMIIGWSPFIIVKKIKIPFRTLVVMATYRKSLINLVWCLLWIILYWTFKLWPQCFWWAIQGHYGPLVFFCFVIIVFHLIKIILSYCPIKIIFWQ